VKLSKFAVLELQNAPEGKGRHGLWLVASQEWMHMDLLSKVQQEVLTANLRDEAKKRGCSENLIENAARDLGIPVPADFFGKESAADDRLH
jgi:hypothetical protein